MKVNEDELYNPVWKSLTDIHFNQAIDYGNVNFINQISHPLEHLLMM
ncbi:MAG: hypothetical protein NWQ07_03920 [Flaviramulus sp.]|nr:hypothetical protein [Flaviramulus sp.]